LIRLPIIFLLFICSSAIAQVNFISKSVESLYLKLPIDCQKAIINSDIIDCHVNEKFIKLTSVKHDNVITHLGLSIFNSKSINNSFPELNQFIERTFLDYLLTNSFEKVLQTTKESSIEMYYNQMKYGSPLFKDIHILEDYFEGKTDYSVKHDSLLYFVKFTNANGEVFQINFPANNTLLTGMDKAELSDYLYNALTHAKDSVVKEWPAYNNSLIKDKDIFIRKGSSIFPGISSDVFYLKYEEKYVPLFDKQYLKESFSNFFLCYPVNEKRLRIHIEYKMYGNISKSIEIGVANLLNLFSKDYELYFGIEDSASNKLRGTLVIYNRKLNYIHILDIQTDEQTLFGGKSSISGKLFSFIPMDNIKSFFGKYKGDLN